jgi:hypothetical protein
MGEDCVAAPYLRALNGAALFQSSVKDLDVPAADAKRRAVALVAALLPPRDVRMLRAVSPRGRTDPFDAALFVLWHTRPADVMRIQ